MLKRFVEQLSKDMGEKQTFAAKDDGSYAIFFEPHLMVSIKEYPDFGIKIVSQVADLPSENLEEFLLRGMSANLFGRETGGNELGVDATGNKVVLSRMIPLQSNYKQFHDCLEDFVNYAEAWDMETVEFSPKK